MSRTGKKPVAPVSGVTVTINGRTVSAKGPKGELSIELMDVVNLGELVEIIEAGCDRSDHAMMVLQSL